MNAEASQVKTVAGFVNKRLEALVCSRRVMVQVDVAIDELFSSNAHYARFHFRPCPPGNRTGYEMYTRISAASDAA